MILVVNYDIQFPPSVKAMNEETVLQGDSSCPPQEISYAEKRNTNAIYVVVCRLTSMLASSHACEPGNEANNTSSFEHFSMTAR